MRPAHRVLAPGLWALLAARAGVETRRPARMRPECRNVSPSRHTRRTDFVRFGGSLPWQSLLLCWITLSHGGHQFTPFLAPKLLPARSVFFMLASYSPSHPRRKLELAARLAGGQAAQPSTLRPLKPIVASITRSDSHDAPHDARALSQVLGRHEMPTKRGGVQPRLTATAQLKILDEVDLEMSGPKIAFEAAAKIVKER